MACRSIVQQGSSDPSQGSRDDGDQLTHKHKRDAHREVVMMDDDSETRQNVTGVPQTIGHQWIVHVGGWFL